MHEVSKIFDVWVSLSDMAGQMAFLYVFLGAHSTLEPKEEVFAGEVSIQVFLAGIGFTTLRAVEALFLL